MGADYYESFDEISQNRDKNLPSIGIGANSVVKKAIADKDVRIGKDVRLVNERGVMEEDGDNYHIRDGIILIPKNAVVKDGTVI